MLPLQDFRRFIEEQALFSKEQSVLLAVSGGKDSVLMAHLFKSSGFNFAIAHCNFGLRKDESTRDERFVEVLAAKLAVPFFITHFDTKKYAKENGISTQMAARNLRYEWFEETRRQEGYDFIALAQHQDDVVETVLLNLTRGTGIAGLHGIFPKRGHLIRPLLFLNREQIEKYVAHESLAFVEDSSNLTDAYARNKIRHHVIPQLKTINPGLQETFIHNVRRFGETEQVLNSVVSRLREDILEFRGASVWLWLKKIIALSPKQLLLFELLRPYRFSEVVVADIIEAIARAHSGKVFYSSSHQLLVDREALIVEPIACSPDETMTLVHPEHTKFVFQDISFSVQTYDHGLIEGGRMSAAVDAGRLIFPLVVRSWQEGDRFKPLGMRGYKKVSDFFVSEKVPLTRKKQVPILVNGNGEIIWICGYRQDDRYKVSESTRQTTVFRIIP